MGDRGTEVAFDVGGFSVMSGSTGAPDAALRWYAVGSAPEAMLMPRREARPFGFDDEPGPEDQG